MANVALPTRRTFQPLVCPAAFAAVVSSAIPTFPKMDSLGKPRARLATRAGLFRRFDGIHGNGIAFQRASDFYFLAGEGLGFSLVAQLIDHLTSRIRQNVF